MNVRVKVTGSGRMSLPADLRKKYGLENGGVVLVEDTGDSLVLRTTSQAVARAQALSRKFAAGRTDMTVDHFLAERRQEWGEA